MDDATASLREDWPEQTLVSFNLYRLRPGIASLKPCEMSAEKVRDFVLGFRLSASEMGRAEEMC